MSSAPPERGRKDVFGWPLSDKQIWNCKDRIRIGHIKWQVPYGGSGEVPVRTAHEMQFSERERERDEDISLTHLGVKYS